MAGFSLISFTIFGGKMGLVIPMHALTMYSYTGHAPDSPRWEGLQSRMDINAGRFTFYHPTLAPVLTDSAKIGLLPEGKFYDNLRGRYERNTARFTHYHPKLSKLLERDAQVRLCLSEIPIPPLECLVIPPGVLCKPPDPGHPGYPGDPGCPVDPVPPVVVPEPATSVQFGIGLVLCGVAALVRKRRAK